MFGLLYFGAGLVYLLLSLGLAYLASRLARRWGGRGWKWGLLVFVGMLLLVFWDWLPMEISFNRLCGTRAGFTQYKSLAQWKQENPGVAGTLRPVRNAKWEVEGEVTRVPLNQRFVWEIRKRRHWFHIIEDEERIVDIETGEVLARYVDFRTDIPPAGVNRNVPGAYKLWLMRRSCPRGIYPDTKWLKNGDSFKGWLVRFKNVGEEQQ